MNSPVMLRDPNGEDAAFGAVIGGMFGFYQGLQIAIDKGLTGWEKFGYGMLGGLIGSSAGLLGGMAGSAVGGSLGTSSFAGGFAAAAVSATVSTTISATSMAWMSGASFWQGMSSGFVQGQIAGLIGGTIGGIAGGINAKSHGGNFWTGDEATSEYTLSTSDIDPKQAKQWASEYDGSDLAGYHKQSLHNRVHRTWDIPNSLKLDDLTTKTGGYGYVPTGKYYNFSTGKEVAGFVRYNGIGNGVSVHISPWAAMHPDDIIFKAVVGHELVHASHWTTLGWHVKSWSEVTAYHYSARVYSSAGSLYQTNYLHDMQQVINYGGYAPASYYRYFSWLR
jgi:hypothetical protein